MSAAVFSGRREACKLESLRRPGLDSGDTADPRAEKTQEPDSLSLRSTASPEIEKCPFLSSVLQGESGEYHTVLETRANERSRG